MTARFYFPASEPFAVFSPSYDGSWTYTSEASRHYAIRAKYASPSALTIGTRVGAWSATAGSSGLDRQLLTGRLKAQSISGTVSAMLMAREYATSDNVDRPYLAVKVVDSSGSVVATLLSLGAQTGSATTEWISNASHRSCTFANGASLSSYSCSDGDRLLFEFGGANSGAGTSPECSFRWGEDATDATVGDNTTTTDVAGWIEFSATLTFLGPTVTGVSPSSGPEAGSTAVTIAGEGFVNGATVTIGGSSATSVVVVSSTEITCVTPSGTGAGDIVVTNPDAETGTLSSGFTYVPPAPPLAVLGSRLKRYYHGYSSSSRVWTDEIGGVDATQDSSGNEPAEFSLDSGYVVPNFDGNSTGSAADFLYATSITTLSTWDGTGYYLWFALIRCDALGPDSEDIVVRQYGAGIDQVGVGSDGKIYAHGNDASSAKSDSSIVNDGITHRVIVQRSADGTLEMWVDGVLQATAGSSSLFGKEWKSTDQEIGARSNLSGDYRYKGLMGSMGFAVDASSFDGDISDLDDALVAYRDGSGTSVTASGIASAEAFGSATLDLSFTLSGIASAEAFGSASVSTGAQEVTASAIVSSEAFGTANFDLEILSSAIGSAEAFGDAALSISVEPSAIASAEAFGSPLTVVYVSPSAIASSEAFGDATASPGAFSVSPSAIGSAEAFGDATTSPGAVSVSPSAIGSAESFGDAAVSPGAVSVSPDGIASSEAISSAVVSSGAAFVSPSGIASGEVFGTGLLRLYLAPSTIASGEAFGTALLRLYLAPTAIVSAEAFGSAKTNFVFYPSAIGSAEAFGSVSFSFGAVSVSPNGIASSEAIGSAVVSAGGASIFAEAIDTGYASGSATATPGATAVSPTGIASAYASGTATFGLYLLPSAIGSAEAFGTPNLGFRLFPSAIGSAERFDSNYSPLDSNPTAFWHRPTYSAETGSWPASIGAFAIGPDGFSSPPAESGGYPSPDDSGNDSALYAETAIVEDVLGAGEKTLFASVDLAAITSERLGQPNDVWAGGALLGDLYGLYLGLFVYRTGAGPYQYWLSYYEWDGDTREAKTEITSLLDGNGGGRLVAQGRKVSGRLEVRANGGAWVSGDACGDTEDVTGFLASAYVWPGFSGTVRALGTWNRAVSDEESDGFYAFGVGGLLLRVSLPLTGIASAYASGSATISPGSVSVSPSGIGSGYVSGTASVGHSSTTTLTIVGIPSEEAFGTVSIGYFVPTIRTSIEARFVPSVSFRVRLRSSTEFAIELRPSTRISIRRPYMPVVVGSVHYVYFETRDEDGELFDPDAVRVRVQSPTERRAGEDGTDYVYGVDSEVENLGVGLWRCAVSVTEAKKWNYSLHTTGPNGRAGVESDYFDAANPTTG